MSLSDELNKAQQERQQLIAENTELSVRKQELESEIKTLKASGVKNEETEQKLEKLQQVWNLLMNFLRGRKK